MVAVPMSMLPVCLITVRRSALPAVGVSNLHRVNQRGCLHGGGPSQGRCTPYSQAGDKCVFHFDST